jgi:ribosomal protein S18 acetylase RimI-like enzyme
MIHDEMGFTQAEALKYLSRKKVDNMLMVTLDDVHAGFMNFKRRGRSVYLCDIDVAERHRRNGLGSALLQELEVLEARQGMKRIRCHVNVDNEASMKFFAKNGYERVRLVKGFYAGECDAYLFMKSL